MGTHITIAEFILISVGSILCYAVARAAYDTWFKKDDGVKHIGKRKIDGIEYDIYQDKNGNYWFK